MNEKEAENDQLKRDLLKYGAHTWKCSSYNNRDKCICGFDEVKENALMIIIKDQRKSFNNSPQPQKKETREIK